MTEYVRMPKAHYEAACISIRAKTGKEDKIKSGDMSAEIESITGGGGSSADVRYVTFMSYDGSKEEGRLPVAVGYDCPTPKFTSTRESTAQYHYTQDGWATSPNGGADTNWYKSITEDKTVYAHFKSEVRSYTITYLDTDGSVLKTETLAYGSTPVYEAEKEGYGFGGWNPDIVKVTGDATYTAVWVEKITFANASWGQIAEISSAHGGENYFAVGDTKTLPLNFSGTIENVLVRIVGFNHDDLADGSGKAGISIALAQGMTNAAINVTENASYGNSYIWENSKTRTLLNSGAVYNALPSELRSVLKKVTKTSNAGYGTDYGGRPKNQLYTTQDKVWLLSTTELGMDSILDATKTAHNQGVQYAYYTSAERRKLKTTDNQPYIYPTRSMNSASSHSTVFAHGLDGSAMNKTLGSSPVRMFGFCI